jgi:hypothetical protein
MPLKLVFKTLSSDEKKAYLINCLQLLSQRERQEVLSSLFPLLTTTREPCPMLSQSEIDFISQVLYTPSKKADKGKNTNRGAVRD